MCTSGPVLSPELHPHIYKCPSDSSICLYNRHMKFGVIPQAYLIPLDQKGGIMRVGVGV